MSFVSEGEHKVKMSYINNIEIQEKYQQKQPGNPILLPLPQMRNSAFLIRIYHLSYIVVVCYCCLYSPLQPGEIQSMTPPSPMTKSIQSVVDVPVPASASFKASPVGQVLSIRVN